jgi:hypothetical protein
MIQYNLFKRITIYENHSLIDENNDFKIPFIVRNYTLKVVINVFQTYIFYAIKSHLIFKLFEIF